MARERYVFPTDRIAHLWAHQTQSSARNPQGNLYFISKVLYSYRNSYPIGNLIPMKSDASRIGLVLIQQNRYGNTTSRHISRALQAVSHMRVIEVPYILVTHTSGHVDNLKWFKDQIEEVTGKALRARTNAEWHLSRLDKLIVDANTYCAYFKIRHRFQNKLTPENMSEMRAKANEAKRKEAKRNEVRDAKRKKQEAEAMARALPDAIARMDSWANGEAVRVQWNDHSLTGRGTMLRVKGNEVETSQGASFPVSHARLGLSLVRRVIAGGQDWHTNGHTCHLGPYKVDKITSDGTVYAGCHVVEWKEIERIAGDIEYAVAVSESHKDHLELAKDNQIV